MKKLILIIFCILCLIKISPAQVVVIANKSVPLDTITSAKLYDYYSRETRLWDKDQPVVVYDLKPKKEIKVLFYKSFGKSINIMKSIWMVNMLSGEGDPPKSLKSEDEMLKRVANTPGAIGFISMAKVKDEVKVLAIIKDQNLK